MCTNLYSKLFMLLIDTNKERNSSTWKYRTHLMMFTSISRIIFNFISLNFAEALYYVGGSRSFLLPQSVLQSYKHSLHNTISEPGLGGRGLGIRGLGGKGLGGKGLGVRELGGRRLGGRGLGRKGLGGRGLGGRRLLKCDRRM